jgi:hypothetical protein
MIETRIEYVIGTIDRREHSCPQCDRVFGVESPDGHLVVGELVLSYFKGRCGTCGNPIKYYSTDARMERMLRGRRTTSPPKKSV